MAPAATAIAVRLPATVETGQDRRRAVNATILTWVILVIGVIYLAGAIYAYSALSAWLTYKGPATGGTWQDQLFNVGRKIVEPGFAAQVEQAVRLQSLALVVAIVGAVFVALGLIGIVRPPKSRLARSGVIVFGLFAALLAFVWGSSALTEFTRAGSPLAPASISATTQPAIPVGTVGPARPAVAPKPATPARAP